MRRSSAELRGGSHSPSIIMQQGAQTLNAKSQTLLLKLRLPFSQNGMSLSLVCTYFATCIKLDYLADLTLSLIR